jgi:hypothetical protein
MCGSLVIFRSQKVSASKKVVKHWYRPLESFRVYCVLLVYLLIVELDIHVYAVLLGCASYSFRSLLES